MQQWFLTPKNITMTIMILEVPKEVITVFIKVIPSK